MEHGRFRDGCRTWNGSSDKKRDWNGRRGDRSGICIIPIVKLLLLAFLYKTVAAVTQRYRTNELQHVSEGSVRGMKCL